MVDRSRRVSKSYVADKYRKASLETTVVAVEMR